MQASHLLLLFPVLLHGQGRYYHSRPEPEPQPERYYKPRPEPSYQNLYKRPDPVCEIPNQPDLDPLDNFYELNENNQIYCNSDSDCPPNVDTPELSAIYSCNYTDENSHYKVCFEDTTICLKNFGLDTDKCLDSARPNAPMLLDAAINARPLVAVPNTSGLQYR